MSRDAERRMVEEVEGVLESFGVKDYVHVHGSKHPAVQFVVNGRRLTYHYGGDDPRSHLNARSDLRNMLLASGLCIVPKPLNSTAQLPEAKPVPPELSQKLLQDPEPKKEQMAPLEVGSGPEPEPVQQPPPQPPRAKLNDDDGYTVYAARELTPSKVIAIELTKDMLATKGSVLIIPLHKPNTIIELSRELFEAMFVDLPVAQSPQVSQAPQPEVEEGKEEEPQEEIEKAAEPLPPINRIQEGISSFEKPRRGRLRKTNYVSSNYRDSAPRSIDGVSAQMGRILAAMVRVTDNTGKVDLTPSSMNGVLLEHDRKQFASRIPGLMRLGLVERGLPLVGTARGWHAKVTTRGRKFLPRLGAWPWLYDGLSVPGWVQQSR